MLLVRQLPARVAPPGGSLLRAWLHPLAPPKQPQNQQCDEAAETQTVLYPSYGQISPTSEYMDNSKELTTYSNYGAYLPTAAICDLDDSPPNSLLKINP